MRKITQSYVGKIGFVPTMGFLHNGHLSLVKAAKKISDIVVVSIYVNPAQFAPDEDLAQYPRDLERDLELLTQLNVDYVFCPDDNEMYPKDHKTWVEVKQITQKLCGKSRPFHFKGVTTIVSKLINIVQPDFMFMGEKDFQQLIVLQQMAKDLNYNVEIIGCPIVRENDGLAMSSRNKYLTEKERINALCLYQSLISAKGKFCKGISSATELKQIMQKNIEVHSGKIDYIEFVDSQTLETVETLGKGNRIIIAVFIGKTRLIDNLEL